METRAGVYNCRSCEVESSENNRQGVKKCAEHVLSDTNR